MDTSDESGTSDVPGGEPRSDRDPYVGRGLFDRTPGALPHLYRGEIHRMKAWRERLAADYRSPDPRITFEEALAHRLRRIYLPLFTVLLGAWAFRVTGFMPGGWPATASVGVVPGTVVTAVVLGWYLAGLAVTLRPRSWRAKGELRSDDVKPWG